jgi:hypothetical protein
MAQEFTINSSAIESKINQLLPSQGGSGAGIDFSASTMVIPIVDLTESAEGSGLRQDLQSCFTHGNVTHVSVINTTNTPVNTTGYWRIFGMSTIRTDASTNTSKVEINDGATDKIVFQHTGRASTGNNTTSLPFDFLVKLEAGDSIKVTSSSAAVYINVTTRQIATLDGTLVNP